MFLNNRRYIYYAALGYWVFAIGAFCIAALGFYGFEVWHFLPTEIDLSNANYSSPGSTSPDGRVHYLGTDVLGRDIAAGILNGFYVSLGTGFVAVLISMIIGLPLGLFSGFFGNHSLRIRKTHLLLILLGILLLGYGLIYFQFLSWPFKIIIFGIAFFLFYIGFQSKGSKDLRALPLDLIIMRLIEVISGLPGLLILLAVAAIFQCKSIWVTALVIGLLRWPVMTLIARNETHRQNKMAFIDSCKALGLSTRRIILIHILPNILTPILITAILGMASAILIESALSFLGIGVALDTQTWGSMLAESRKQISAWWLAVFPGLFIFLTVFSLHLISSHYRDGSTGFRPE